MKIQILFIYILFGTLQISAQPFLQKQDAATQLVVNEKPFIMLGGELGNSSASSAKDLAWIFPKLKSMNLNTVLVPAYWELLEPEKGKFDFALIDTAIDLARKNDLKIVFLWYGSWKNSMSCYAPAWVKENYKQYPRAVTENGQSLEMMSAFEENNIVADKEAFVALLKHIKNYDGKNQTVIMIQVENEIGMLESAREYGRQANELFNTQVPKQLTDYLQKNKIVLQPFLSEEWTANGAKTKGTWSELFGTGIYTDEIFQAYYYGLYVQQIAQAGKDVYALPMFLNAALDSRGRKPGAYPSAGPLAHLLDIWRAAAPAIDLIAPDIYDPDFSGWAAQYYTNGNPLFVPEIKINEANAVRVLYALGQYEAMGFSPFSIEDVANPETYPLTKSYAMLKQLLPLLTGNQGKNKTCGVLLEEGKKEQKIEKNGYAFNFSHYFSLPWEKQSDSENRPAVGAVMIELSKNEYIIAGSGIVVTFDNIRKDGYTTGIGSIDQVQIDEGKIVPIRRLNGDQDHQGRHLRIPFGEFQILYVKLYNYK